VRGLLVSICSTHVFKKSSYRLHTLFERSAVRWAIQQEGAIMQTVIRRYSGKGAKELFDLLEKRTADVEELMRSVKGFVGYTLARSGDGGFSVTVCKDKAGIDESVQKAKDWIAKNAGSTGAAAPEVSEGAVLIHLK
jgi:hypothetical protein